MTLQTGGPISLADARAEYQINGSISMSQLYDLPALPSGGPISMSDLYGKSNVRFIPDSGSATSYVFTQNYITNYLYLTATTAGVWTFNLPNGVSSSIQSGSVIDTIGFSITGFGSYFFDVTVHVGGVSHSWSCQLATDNGA